MAKTLIKLDKVSKTYRSKRLFKDEIEVQALKNIDLEIYESETLALVGESGCGKTTLGKLILGLLEPSEGEVYFRGQPIYNRDRKKQKAIRKNMQMVFQDPYSSINPKLKIGSIVEEPLLSYKVYGEREEREKKVGELLQAVGLGEDYRKRYPNQLSGGQRQRVGIARALALEPDFIVCDEPTSALDVSIQSQILNLLIDLQASRKLSYLFISHDLGVVRYIADRVCVMYMGGICELGQVDEIYDHPRHPYTRYLLDAVPKISFDLEKDLSLEEGLQEGEQDHPGCSFYPKCRKRTGECREVQPPRRTEGERTYYCHNPL